MFTRERVPMTYTRAELLSDAAVHVTGIVAALIAVPVLITLAAVWFGDATTVIAAVVYGVSLLAMFICSAANNMIRMPARKDLLRRIDQSAIYVKIAGSYTPLAVLTGTHAGLFLASLWGAALAGASLRMFSGARLKWPSILSSDSTSRKFSQTFRFSFHSRRSRRKAPRGLG
jgi:hemolysin III